MMRLCESLLCENWAQWRSLDAERKVNFWCDSHKQKLDEAKELGDNVKFNFVGAVPSGIGSA